MKWQLTVAQVEGYVTVKVGISDKRQSGSYDNNNRLFEHDNYEKIEQFNKKYKWSHYKLKNTITKKFIK